MNLLPVRSGQALAARLPTMERFRLHRGDHEFLPAVIEILETPLSPIRTSVTLTLCGFVVIALAWSYLGRVDIIAPMQGKIQPVGRTKTIEPLETGRVQQLLVQDGQTVRAGDVLVELDAGEDEADRALFADQVASSKAEIVRRKLALQMASTGMTTLPRPIEWPPGSPSSVADRETRVLSDDLAQLAANLATLKAQILEKSAAVERLKGTIAAQDGLAAISKQRFDMRSELLSRGAGSKAAVIDAQETYQNQYTALVTQKGELAEAEQALQTAGRQVERTTASFLSDNANKLADAERRVDEETQKLAKARVKTGRMELRSPIDGRVQGLTVTTLGQVVSSGEQIMQVVPANGALEIEAYLANADAGFVQAGQGAVVKVQSFPFTDYGTLDAKVVRVADDAIPLPDADKAEENPAAGSKGSMFGGAQRMQNLMFPVTLELARATIGTSAGPVPLKPGMAVTVEIKTGRRRILSYVAAPLVETFESAFGER